MPARPGIYIGPIFQFFSRKGKKPLARARKKKANLNTHCAREHGDIPIEPCSGVCLFVCGMGKAAPPVVLSSMCGCVVLLLRGDAWCSSTVFSNSSVEKKNGNGGMKCADLTCGTNRR